MPEEENTDSNNTEDVENILVIDDEQNIRTALTRCLRAEGYEVTVAVNGEDGLEKLNKEDFHLILLDMKLPGMDGIEVLRRIREYHSFTPVIMITAYGTVESAVEAMKLGAVDYLNKPFPPEEIRKVVSQVLSRGMLKESDTTQFTPCIEMAKSYILHREYDTAFRYLEKALEIDSSRPEPFNMMGVLLEIKGNIPEAQKRYRAALALDPTYKPAQQNLHRVVQYPEVSGKMVLE